MDGTRPQHLYACAPEPSRYFGTVLDRRKLMLLLGGLLAFGCGGLFLYTALTAPRRTPLFILSANYAPAWDLNPWTNENANLLRQMDRRSLSVISGGDGSDVANGNWTKFDEQLLATIDQRSQMPVLLYLNLHGGVDDAGEPRLIPVQAPSDDPRSWMSVWDLLQHVDELLRDRPRSAVLLLECGRSNRHTPAASGATTFASAMQRLLESRAKKLNFENLHVLLASTDNRPTVTDWHVGCDLFTRELARGLHGAADQREYGGNQDGYVQFAELSAFVSEQVGRWSQHHRASRQVVWSWSHKPSRTDLTWKLSGEFQFPEPLPAPAAHDLEQIHQAWQSVSALHDQRPWKAFPGQWQTLCNYVLGLEQAVHGGQAAREKIPTLTTAVKDRADWLQQQLKALPNNQTIEQRVAEAQSITWGQVAKASTDSPALRADTRETGADPLGSVPVLELLARDQSYKAWSQPSISTRYARIRSQAATQAASVEPAIQAKSWRESDSQEELRSLELAIDDSLLADVEPRKIVELIDRYERRVQQWEQICQAHQQQIEFRDATLANLPEVAECLLSVTQIAESENPSQAGASEFHQLEDQLVLLSMTTARLCEVLADDDATFGTGSLPDLAAMLQPLVDRQTQLWEQLLRDDLEPSAAHLDRLRSLVNFAWFPTRQSAPFNLGLIRTKAWMRLREWEHRVDSVPLDAALAEDITSSLNTQPDHEFQRYLAACVLGKSRSSALSPAEMRGWLRQMRGQALSVNPDDLTGVALQAWNRAALESRLSAGLTGISDDGQSIANYHNLCAAHRVLTFAEETLDSFWSVPRHDSQPYYTWLTMEAVGEVRSLETRLQKSLGSSVANSVAALAAATGRRQPGSTSEAASSTAVSSRRLALAQRIQLVTERMEQRELAARSALKSRPRWIPDLDTSLMRGEDALSWLMQVDVETGEHFGSLPTGTACVTLGGGSLRQRQPLEVDQKFSGAALTFSLGAFAQQPSDEPSPVNIALTFRGHDYPSQLLPQPDPGRVVRAKYVRASSTGLTIYDESPGPRLRTFILDCSASMVEPATGEINRTGATANARPDMNKLDAAKLALLDLLRHMRDEGDQVSVLLYGHRIAQGSAEQGTLQQTKYLEKFPSSGPLEPYADVETILPLGRFGEAEYQSVSARLAQVLPWGQTPLYLALAEALQTERRNSSAHDVVVISDGRNYQFNPSPDKRPEPEEVIQLAQDRHAAIHVIGFGVPADQVADSSRQFEQLAQGTGGTATLQIADASLLSQRLVEFREPATYRVLLVDGSTFTGFANERLTLPDPKKPNEKIAIEYAGKSYFVPLNAGAALRLSVDARGNLIVDAASQESIVLVGLLDADRQPTGTLIGLSPPTRTADVLSWKLSLQSQDAQVIPRPQRVWVELQPSSSNAQPTEPYQPYVFAGNNWSNDTPLPVLEFTTADWPIDADRARISVWVMDHVPQVDDELKMEIGTQHWRPRDDVEIRMHQAETTVTALILGQAGHKITDWSLWLDHPALTAVMHSTNRISNTSLHRFDWLRDDRQSSRLSLDPTESQRTKSKRSGPHIELFSISQFKQGASTLARPIELQLNRPLTALSPTPKLQNR